MSLTSNNNRPGLLQDGYSSVYCYLCSPVTQRIPHLAPLPRSAMLALYCFHSLTSSIVNFYYFFQEWQTVLVITNFKLVKTVGFFGVRHTVHNVSEWACGRMR